MTTPLFHHTFTPLRNSVVASEAAWKKPARIKVPSLPCPANCRGGFTMASYHGIPCKACGTNGFVSGPCRVLVTGDDLFAESEGPFESLEGLIATRTDILSRLCSIFDACPNLTFVVRTRHTENVMRMMPPIGRDRIPDDENGIPTANPLKRPNLILMAECHDQRDIDRQVPHLLRCRDLCGVIGVHAVPSEAMDLKRVGKTLRGEDIDAFRGIVTRYQYKARTDFECSMGVSVQCHPPETGKLDWLTISGSAAPLPPAWVRSLVDQAKAAGCPVWCDVALDGRTWEQLPGGRS